MKETQDSKVHSRMSHVTTGRNGRSEVREGTDLFHHKDNAGQH